MAQSEQSESVKHMDYETPLRPGQGATAGAAHESLPAMVLSAAAAATADAAAAAGFHTTATSNELSNQAGAWAAPTVAAATAASKEASSSNNIDLIMTDNYSYEDDTQFLIDNSHFYYMLALKICFLLWDVSSLFFNGLGMDLMWHGIEVNHAVYR